MKKILTIIASFILFLALFGCANKKEVKTPTPTPVESSSEEKTPTPVHVHDYVYHNADPATYYLEGNLGYYTCLECEKVFDTAKNEITMAETVDPIKTITVDCKPTYLTKYGNVYINLKKEDILKYYSFGDVLTVSFLGNDVEVPLVAAYTDIANGVDAILSRTASKDEYVMLATNGANFATKYEIGTMDSSNTWTFKDNLEEFNVTIKIKEKAGYLNEFLSRNITYTNNREDYSSLSGQNFANFREIQTTNIGNEILFRSSSPINPAINRNQYADYYTRLYGVKTIINLADSKEVAEAYEGYSSTYYSKQSILYVNMGVASATEVSDALKEIIPFMAENEGPYLIHCKEGKDRAGVISAIIELYMGATFDDVCIDYMKSFENYSFITSTSPAYTAILNDFVKIMTDLGVTSNKKAIEYIDSLGIDRVTLSKAAANLTEDTTNIRIFNFSDYSGDLALFGKDFTIEYSEVFKNTILDYIDSFIDEIEKGEVEYSELEKMYDKYQEYTVEALKQKEIIAVYFYYYYTDDYSELLTDATAFYAKLVYSRDDIYIALANSKYKHDVFKNWTDEEIASYASGLSSNNNEEILETYNVLSQADTAYRFEEIDFYQNMNIYLTTGKDYAALFGDYKNYLEFAYAELYGRTYNPEEVAEYCDNVAKYIAPLNNYVYKNYKELLASLTEKEKAEYSTLYNDFRNNYDLLENFYRTISPEALNTFIEFFKEGNYVLSNNKNANVTACVPDTLYVPYIFFGANNQDIDGFIHEFGHYYAGLNAHPTKINDYDLGETQSQGDEVLFCAYLEQRDKTYSERVKELYNLKVMHVILDSIVTGAYINELEAYCYSLDELTEELFEAKYTELCKKYNDTTPAWWYKDVLITYRGYYISYSISAFAALEIYALACDDYNYATDIYDIIAYCDGQDYSLFEILDELELGNMLSEDTFINLYDSLLGHRFVYIGAREANHAHSSNDAFYFCLDCFAIYDMNLNQVEEEKEDEIIRDDMLKAVKTTTSIDELIKSGQKSLQYFSQDIKVEDIFVEMEIAYYYLEDVKKYLVNQDVDFSIIEAKINYAANHANTALKNYYTLILLSSIFDSREYNDLANESLYFYRYAWNTIHQFCIDIVDTKYIYDFYEDWTLEEIYEYIKQFNPEESSRRQVLEDTMSSLVIEYQSGSKTYGEIIEDYKAAGKELAKIDGYDDFLEYRYKVSYGRDYCYDDIKNLKDLYKKYLMPLENYSGKYMYSGPLKNKLGTQENIDEYNRLTNGSFLYEKSNIDKYAQKVGGDYLTVYNDFMKNGYYYLSDIENDYVTAFSYAFYDGTPFLFFGNGYYQGIKTFIHEFGHHYGHSYGKDYMLDLAEIHSQGNESLYLAYTLSQTTSVAMKQFEYWWIETMIPSITTSYAVAELEAYIFSDEVMNDEKIEKYIDDLCKETGFWLNYDYFVRAAGDEPGYYYSYAVSAQVALEIYSIALTDIDKAIACYNKICNPTDTKFLKIVEDAGLTNPFTEASVKKIYDSLLPKYSELIAAE